MSLILDALRKIELERKSKRQSSQEIRREVLNYRGITPAAAKSRTVVITAALLLAFAAVACFFYLKRPEPPRIEPALQRETLKQEPAPVTQLQPVQPQPPEPPVQKQFQREVNSSATPVTKATNTDTVKQKNGDEGITVSGIAWQDERSMRRAVINGFLVGEGAEIQGAKIIEIKESRVRFSRGGEVFEVVHTSGAGK
jgi:general secretion pathway protein B